VVPRLVTFAAIALIVGMSQSTAVADAFAWLIPTASIDASGRTRLASGVAWVATVRGASRELAVYGAVRTTAETGSFERWARQSHPVRSGSYVQVGGRFSDPPRLEDLKTLVLDPVDVDGLGACRPRDCELKLSATEILQVRGSIAAAGPDWKRAAQQVFKDILLERAQRYWSRGDGDTAAYADRRTALSPVEEFAALLGSFNLDEVYGPDVGKYLRSYPDSPPRHVESFLSWSRESLGAGKPIVSLTHLTIVRRRAPHEPQALVAAKQIYASHYLTGSVSLTALVDDDADGSRYLVYARRSRVDLLSGPFAPLLRRTMERRIRSEGPTFLDKLRQRLENGLTDDGVAAVTPDLSPP
jgi:hypothetical protein